MNEITTTKDPAVLAVEIRTLQQQAQVVVLSYAIEIGRRLNEAKAVLDHGQWGPWLEREVNFSQSTANNYMKIFERYGSDQVSLFGDAKSQTLGNLPYTKALKLLAVPEDEVETFVEEHDVANMSTRELEQAIRERDEAKRKLEAVQDDAAQVILDAEEAVEKAKGEAETLRKELEKLKDKVDKAGEDAKAAMQKDIDTAAAAQKAAEAAKADAEARAKALEEKLKTADGDAAVFKVYFSRVQDDLNRMLGMIQKAEPAQKEKFRTALRALLDSVGGAM